MNYKRCYNCKFWARKDEGYSNWTVTETYVHCLKKNFEPVEESYSWHIESRSPEGDHEFFKQAEKCNDYKFGDGIQLDVEGETTIEDYKEDDELYQVAQNYDGW